MALMTEEAGKVPIAVVPEIQAHPKRWLFLAILFLVGTSVRLTAWSSPCCWSPSSTSSTSRTPCWDC